MEVEAQDEVVAQQRDHADDCVVTVGVGATEHATRESFVKVRRREDRTHDQLKAKVVGILGVA